MLRLTNLYSCILNKASDQYLRVEFRSGAKFGCRFQLLLYMYCTSRP